MMFHQGARGRPGGRARRGARAVRERDDVGSRLRPPPDPLQRLLDARAAAARRVAQPAAAPRRADAARDPGHRLLRPAPRFQRQPGDELGRRALLPVARAARARGDARPRARRASSPTSPARSTWPSGSASPCIPRPTSRPSRAGRASAGTFGEDAELAARLVAAYIRGFQGESLGPDSVACMTKHFPGGGPQHDGEDPHFPYGREQVYPGGNFDYHLIPFEAALAAGTAQIMPYYGMPVGTALEEVGFGFNRGVITALLRERYGFDGVVCTDWGLLNDTSDRRHDLAGARLGRRAPDRRGADAEGPRRRRRPVRRRACAPTCSSISSARAVLPRSGSTSPCAGCCGTSSASASSTTPTSTRTRPPRSSGSAAFRERGDGCPAPVARAPEGRRPAAAASGRPKIYVEGVDAARPRRRRRGRRAARRTPTSRSCGCRRRSSRGTASSWSSSSTPAGSTSTPPSSSGCWPCSARSRRWSRSRSSGRP